MTWERLHPISIESFFSKKLTARVNKTNEAISARLAEREAIDRQMADGQITGAQVSGLRGSIIDALQAELTVRNEITKRLTEIRAERERAWEAARQATDNLEVEVRDSLVAAGYIDVPNPTEFVIGRIQPGWIAQHPKVFASRQARDALRYHRTDAERENQTSANNIETALAAMVRHAAPV